MKILIQIEDRENGTVGLSVKPNFKEMAKLLMENNNSEALFYATKALQALSYVHQESKRMAEESSSGIILPKDFGIM